MGVVKAYSTRVGAGPFITELHDELGENLREWGGEYGSTTGRSRRCGWFDCVPLRRSLQLGGITNLALMKLDVLDKLDEIKLCTHYMMNGQRVDLLPFGLDENSGAEPVYETMPGWKTSLSEARSYDEFPQAAKDYVNRIEELLQANIDFISVGPDRKETIFRDGDLFKPDMV